jgi:hypothetical protein
MLLAALRILKDSVLHLDSVIALFELQELQLQSNRNTCPSWQTSSHVKTRYRR